MKKYRTIAVSVLVSICLVACATFVKNSYVALDGTGVTYNVAMTGVSAAQLAGKITPEQRATINKGGLVFYSTYQVAVDALLAYNQNSSATGQQAVQIAVTQLLANWLDVANLINSILPGAVPVASQGALFLKGKTAAGQPMTVVIKRLDAGTISIIIQVGASVVQMLIPAVQGLIADINKLTISDSDILALKALIKLPDQY